VKIAEEIRKLTAALEEHLCGKNQHQKDVEDELEAAKEVVKRDSTLHIIVKRIGLNVPMEAIMVIIVYTFVFLSD
jgi:hypothetical protein